MLFGFTPESRSRSTGLPTLLPLSGRNSERYWRALPLRHSYAAWLDELGAPITLQQRAMRYRDLRVMVNYGDAIGEGLREASAKVAAKATDRKQSTAQLTYRNIGVGDGNRIHPRT